MPKKSIKPPSKASISTIISDGGKETINSLTTDAQVLFEFLVLVIDIRYRNKYLKSFDYNEINAYSQDMELKEPTP